MKQAERRQQTIQLILETTEQLIREKGCDSVTMKDIVDRSGLSKGAIFHYVKSKNEIFAWVLQEGLDDIDQRFTERENKGKKEFQGSLNEITKRFRELQDPESVTNQILVYLLSKSGQKEIDEVLDRFYRQSVQLSRQWIETGQTHGVIPSVVDSNKMGELFVLISLGLRMRSFLTDEESSFEIDDYITFLKETLNGGIG